MKNLLYIGLNGYAGSGKDTVAKMIKTILSYEWETIEECMEFYNKRYTSIDISATFNKGLESENNLPVICIAFADQLKKICSSIFGIPVERFYKNKATAWICINKDFQYTEIKPTESEIVTSEEYYNNINNYKYSDTKYWMSLREILVYIGTYVCQQDINKKIFVNIVENNIKENSYINPNLEYAIVTDIRFTHELDYIKEHNGITINIVRGDIQQLDNIAEHELDEEIDYDYIINNNGTYNELFQKVWDLCHNEVIFKNITFSLFTHDNINNYLRLIFDKDDEKIYKLCSPYHIARIHKDNGEIMMIDPTGGPSICLDDKIAGTNIIPYKIELDTYSNSFLIYA